MMNRGERGGQSWVDKVVNYISRNVINITAICYYNPLQSFSFSTLIGHRPSNSSVSRHEHSIYLHTNDTEFSEWHIISKT